jgi:hypothetical protein
MIILAEYKNMIMKKIIMPVLFVALSVNFGCEELLETGLSDVEIVDGLKAALDLGLNTSVATASVEDGYLKNEVIKILLPPEVTALQNEIESGSVNLGFISVSYATILDAYVAITPDIESNPFDELLIAMNRGAEQAADKALPIFANSLTSMSVTDALGILQGSETAATDYFYNTTNVALVDAFQPEVKAALDQTKANALYTSLAGFLNYEYTVAGISTLRVADLIDQQIPATLDQYATEKATAGLFHLVGEEEKKIRANPLDWASDIIAKVFGSSEAQGG